MENRLEGTVERQLLWWYRGQMTVAQMLMTSVELDRITWVQLHFEGRNCMTLICWMWAEGCKAPGTTRKMGE